MKTKEFYIQEAELLKVRVNDIRNKGAQMRAKKDILGDDYPGMSKAIMDFKHLVHAFDGNLPLAKYLTMLDSNKPMDLPFSSGDDDSYFEKFIYFIDYFIEYIKKYTD